MSRSLPNPLLRQVFVALALAVTLVAVGLAMPGHAFATGYTIMGNVSNQTGDVELPVVGIKVQLFKFSSAADKFVLQSQVATTDSNGQYVFSALEAGDYTVGVAQGARDAGGVDYAATYYYRRSSLDYADFITLPDSQNVDGNGSSASFISADLFPALVGPAISGVVKGSDYTPQMPISDAEVDLLAKDSGGDWVVSDFAETNASGLYEFWGEQTGTYTVGYLDRGPTEPWGVRWKTEFLGGASHVESATLLHYVKGAAMHLTGKNLTLDKARAVVRGVVRTRDASGDVDGVADGCDIAVMPQAGGADGFPAALTDTDDSGRYTLYDADFATGAVATESVLRFGGWQYSKTYWNDAPDFASGTTFSVGPASALTSKDGFVRRVAPVIEGRVTGSDTSSGVAGVIVYLYSADATNSGQWINLAMTGADGTYQLPTPDRTGHFKLYFDTDVPSDPGLAQLHAPGSQAAEYLGEWFDGKGDLATADVVAVSGTPVTCDAALEPNPFPSITGSALDTASAPVAGVEPVAYQHVAASPGDPGGLDYWEIAGWASEPTTGSGAYRVWGLADGDYKVGHGLGGGISAEPNGNSYSEAYFGGTDSIDDATTVTVLGGSTASGVDVPYSKLNVLITGHVADEFGGPVEGVWVQAWAWTSGDGGYADWEPSGPMALTDSSGDYALVGDAGAYKLEFEAAGFIGQLYDGIAVTDGTFDAVRSMTVTTTADATVAGIDATLTPIAQTAVRVDGTRYGSSSRYTVAVDVASRMTDGFVHTPDIILACGEDRAMADPLAAAGLSWAYHGAPVLLTPSGSGHAANYSRPYVPGAVLAAIKTAVYNMRLSHTASGITLHIVGGGGSVPSARIAEIRNYTQKTLGLTTAELNRALIVTRVQGRTRYENAASIADEMKARRGSEMPSMTFIVNGADPAKFFDAMAAAPISAADGVPMLLVTAVGTPPSATRGEIARLGLAGDQLVVAGPAADVSEGVRESLGATRVAGPTADSYATARAIDQWAIARGLLGEEGAGVSAKLPDALGAGPFLGSNGAGMLFTKAGSASVPAPTLGFLSANKDTLGDVWVFGGGGSVPSGAVTAINNAIKR